ncbi:hypothetical protein ACFV0L_25285 [Streptosporangium canum]|uniref:hypothetical protein n=1 Tax=Streptosporangium canum TaxID=324952 RepID=UPI0011607435|nr:hypothetical protein [Streptosporangium canum]
MDHQTERPVWKVSQPTRSEEQNGKIILGDVRGFAKQETPLNSPLPHMISVTVQVTNDSPIGSGFLLDNVSRDLAGTSRVLKMGEEVLTEEEFRRQVNADYC